MQSSARNAEPARLPAASHSPRGELLLARRRCSIAVADRPAADAELLVALAAATREVAHRRADAAGEDEPGRCGSACDDRQLRLQLAADVRGCAELAAQVLDRVRELARARRRARCGSARACAAAGISASAPPSSAWPRWIACSGTGGVPFLILPSASTPSRPASANRPSVTISSASQVDRNVASAAAIVAKTKPRPKNAKSAAPTPRPIPTAERGHLLLQLERRELDLEPRDRRGVLGDGLRRAADSAVRRCCSDSGGVGMASPVEHLGEHVAARERRADHGPRARPAAATASSASAARAAGPTARAVAEPAARRSAPRPWRAPRSGSASACAGTSGSSANASPTFALTPPLAFASRTNSSSLSAAESTAWSALRHFFVGRLLAGRDAPDLRGHAPRGHRRGGADPGVQPCPECFPQHAR